MIHLTETLENEIKLFLFHANTSVKDALSKIKEQATKKRAPSNLFVIDAERKLIGVLSLRDLITSQSADSLELIMNTDVLSVQAFDQIDSALKIQLFC